MALNQGTVYKDRVMVSENIEIQNPEYFVYLLSHFICWPCRLELQNTPTTSLQRDKTPATKCFGYDTKQSDDEAPVMLELWGMWSTPLLPSLPVHSCPK